MFTCEQIQLSTSMRVSLKIPIPASKAPDKGATTASTAPLEVVLTRGQLEKLAAPLYKRMREAINSACWQVCLPQSGPVSLMMTMWSMLSIRQVNKLVPVVPIIASGICQAIRDTTLLW